MEVYNSFSFLFFQLFLYFGKLCVMHLFVGMKTLLDSISFRLNFNQFFGSIISIFIGLSFFEQLFMSTSLETFHSLIEISSGIHFQALLFPRVAIGSCNNFIKDLNLFLLISFFGSIEDILFGDNFNYIQLVPDSFDSWPSRTLSIIINYQCFSWSCDSSVKKF